MQTLTIRIVKASVPSYWYAKRIGETFEVWAAVTRDNEYVVRGHVDGKESYVKIGDCEAIGD